MLNNVLNVQVSDTTGDDSSNAAKYIENHLHIRKSPNPHIS